MISRRGLTGKRSGKPNLELKISCTGEVDLVEDLSEPPFNYVRYQRYRVCKMNLERLERCQWIKNGLETDQLEDYTNANLTAKMQSEFGPMNIYSECYKGYFNSYKKASLNTLDKWIQKENNLDKSKGHYPKKQIKFKTEMEQHLKYCSAFKSLSDGINFQHVDWFELPRPDFSCVDVRNSSFIKKVFADGCKIITAEITHGLFSDPHSTVMVLPNTEQAPLNLIFFDPMVALPLEIHFEKISEEEAQKLKCIIFVYPNGISVEEYLNTFRDNYGTLPDYQAFGTFENMCESLVDIFLITDEVVPGRRLLFPAFWFGILKPINLIMKNILHSVKFIVNFHGGSIFSNDILQQLKYFFNVDFQPLDWGFESEENFFSHISTFTSPQPAFYLCYDEVARKYKLNSTINAKKDFSVKDEKRGN